MDDVKLFAKKEKLKLMVSVKKLNALTSLRFVAAALIVIHHSRGLFGFGEYLLFPFQLDQGVSFFFVLSGFILAYAYPNLNGFKNISRFLLSRFARIWPAHVVAFLLLCLLFPSPFEWYSLRGYNPFLLAGVNLFMVHGWIPIETYFFSFNNVSWSISTEFFFIYVFHF